MDEQTPQDRAATYRRSAAIYRQLTSETRTNASGDTWNSLAKTARRPRRSLG
jgi:hypothetical protein